MGDPQTPQTVTSPTHFTMLNQSCQMCLVGEKTPGDVLYLNNYSMTKLDFDHKKEGVGVHALNDWKNEFLRVMTSE